MSGTDDGVVSNEERRKVKEGHIGKLQTRLTASARHSEDVLPKINQIKELRKSIVKK